MCAVTPRTPPDAVPIGSFTKAGNVVHPSASMAVDGWGMPRRRKVPKAQILSWTAANEANRGTTVATLLARSRSWAKDSTATCSWVGNKTSKCPNR